jgi:hypothetical protein
MEPCRQNASQTVPVVNTPVEIVVDDSNDANAWEKCGMLIHLPIRPPPNAPPTPQLSQAADSCQTNAKSGQNRGTNRTVPGLYSIKKSRALDLPFKNKPDHATKLEKGRGRSRIKCQEMNKAVRFSMGVNCG